MKYLQNSAVLSVFCLMVAVSACSGGGGGDTATPATNGNPTGNGGGGGGGTVVPPGNNAAPIDITITGLVTGVSGTPVSGALVSLGTGSLVTALTSSTGSFSLTTQSTDTRLVVNTSAAGFAPQLSIIDTQPSVTIYGMPVTLYRTINRVISDPSLSTSLTVTAMGRPATITVPAGAVTGASPFTLRVVSYDPATGPGNLESINGTLMSGGMFYIEVVDSNGDPATFTAGATIQIALSSLITPSVPGADPFQSWQMDRQNGLWSQPGAVTPPSSGTVMNISNAQGYWNIDCVFPPACVTGTLKTQSGGICTGGTVKTSGQQGAMSYKNTDSTGGFCLNGVPSTPAFIVAGRTQTPIFFSPISSRSGCGLPQNCTPMGTIIIPDSDCNGSVISQPTTTTTTGQCGVTTLAGGDAPETHVVDLGRASGTFDFSFDTVSIQDQIIVTYQGTTLFDTGCVGAAGTQTLTYSGTATTVTVQVNPNCAGGTTGTAWDFTVGCPI